MLVLVVEVYYYKRKAAKKKKIIPQTSDLRIVPYNPRYPPIDYAKDKNNSILLGHGDFIPAAKIKPRLSSYFSESQSRY
jgi:hypothetical protein